MTYLLRMVAQRVVEPILGRFPNRASQYRWWWLWMLVGCVKTVSLLCSIGQSWTYAWYTGRKLYPIRSYMFLRRSPYRGNGHTLDNGT